MTSSSPVGAIFIGDLRIITSTQCVDYLPLGKPARYHRKKRIQKKWIKRYGRRYVEVPKPDLLEIKKGVFVGHPETVAKLKAQIEQEASV